MFTCPSCNELTIPAYGKFSATRSSPVKCRKCKNFSTVSGNIQGIFIIALNIFFYTSIFAILYGMFLPIIATIIFAIVAEIIIYKYAPLKVISEKEVKNTNFLYKLGFIAVLIIILVTVIENA